MRLLDVDSLKLEEFGDAQARPSYAILSHTWGSEEVNFSDYVADRHMAKAGYTKIQGVCRLAQSEGFRHVWIDTCCIDQSSSAELSETINSMFEFYRNAAVCYVYLADVHDLDGLEASRWFTRGWTLQELLAPLEVVFLSADWSEIGTKRSLCGIVSKITRIDESVLKDGDWSGYTVGQKMSWAAGRRTTRLEDEAYCLMGLFDVNMPLLYGEGRKAFLRLQQQILKATNDQSLFAWACENPDRPRLETSGLLAKTPDVFKCASHVRPLDVETDHEAIFEVVNQLIRIQVPLVQEVQGLKMCLLTTNPPTHQVLEIQSNQQANGDTLAQRSMSTDSKIWTVQSEVSSAPVQRPQIKIEVEDGGSKTLVHRPDIEDDPVTDMGTPPKNPCGCLEGPPGWCLYIYEPAIIVPLRCQIGGHPLGILLSKHRTKHDGSPKELQRLHRPSLVTLDHVLNSGLWVPATKYVVMSSPHSTCTPRSSLTTLPKPLRWPEIRVGNLISSGYNIDTDYMIGWDFNKSRSAYVPYSLRLVKPFVLAYHQSGDDATHPNFSFSITEVGDDELLCHAEVYSDDPAKILQYDACSFDLAQMRRAQVSLKNGNGLVAVYREASDRAFVSLSIEPLVKNRFLVETTIGHTTAARGQGEMEQAAQVSSD